jgi:hypothetical protein
MFKFTKAFAHLSFVLIMTFIVSNFIVKAAYPAKLQKVYEITGVRASNPTAWPIKTVFVTKNKVIYISYKCDVNVGGQNIVTLRSKSYKQLIQKVNSFEDFLRNLPADTIIADFNIEYSTTPASKKHIASITFRNERILLITESDSEINQLKLFDYVNQLFLQIRSNCSVIAPRHHYSSI